MAWPCLVRPHHSPAPIGFAPSSGRFGWMARFSLGQQGSSSRIGESPSRFWRGERSALCQSQPCFEPRATPMTNKVLCRWQTANPTRCCKSDRQPRFAARAERMGLEWLPTIRRLDLHLAGTFSEASEKRKLRPLRSRPLQPALLLSVQFITNGGMTHKHTPVSIAVTCHSQTIRVSDPG